MKILQLNFKNINNLKGTHQIDFTKTPLAKAGIFAITGPTGSGKSTILDVITLALFNKIPRFKNISKSQLESLGSVITRHTDDAFAKITFTIKEQIFTSEWKIKRARTGNLKEYEMYLYDANGSVLDLKKSEVPKRNEQLIGLEYPQFIQSILLSQGEFARFLKADKNDRGKLLENITGTGIYRKLGVAAFQKKKSLEHELALTKSATEEIKLLNEEDVKLLIDEQSKLNQENKNFEITISNINTQLNLKQQIQTIEGHIQTSEEQQVQYLMDYEKFKPQIQKLKINDQLAPVKLDYFKYDELKKNIAKLKKENALVIENKENKENAFSLVLDKMHQLTKEDVNKENFKSVMASFEADVNKMDHNLGHIVSKGKEKRDEINALIQQHQLNIDRNIQPQVAIEQLTSINHKISEKLSQAKLDKNDDIQEIKKTIEKLRNENTQLDQLITIKRDKEKSKAELSSSIKHFNENEQILKQNKPLLQSQKKLLLQINTNIDALRQREKDAIKISKLSDLRQELMEGTACPLCGSKEHPYSEHHTAPVQGEIQASIQTKIIERKEVEDGILNLNNTIESAKTTCQLLESNKARLTDYIQNLEKNEANYSKSQSQESLDNLTDKAKSNTLNIKTFEEAVSLISTYKAQQNIISKFEGLNTILQEHASLSKARKIKFDGSNVNVVTNKLQDDFTGIQNDLIRLQSNLDRHIKQLAEDEKECKILQSNIQPKIISLGFDSLHDIEDHIISDALIVSIRQQSLKLNNKKISIETALKNFNLEKDKLQKKDKQPDESLFSLQVNLRQTEEKRNTLLQRIGEITSLVNRNNEDKKRMVSKQKEIENLDKEVSKWSFMNKMIGDANGHKFANFAQSLTLQNLLVLANKRLQKLSDRYLLDKPKDDNLMVIDQYQGNIQRAVTTLSGGESFLISLALSLSLSDMASKNVALDSLFIDEGFGTLDQETLDVAISTLERLQSETQKTVGVISHVEALKERIHVQIKLQKNPQGYSKIALEG